MRGIQDTSTADFRTIIGSGTKFRVPKFQRDYSWEKEQWDDLWQDIEAMIEAKDDHYMGYLVLQTTEGKDYQIIDGQQRFTTITLLILAAIKCIIKKGGNSEEERMRAKSLLDSYVGSMDPISLEYDNKLVLNRNNNDYYKDYIVKFDKLRVSDLKATDKLMRGCFEFYEKKMTEGRYAAYNGQDYATLVTYIVDNLYFTRITVNDEMNAFKVFETLNARGVQLSSSDLLKNYLFSIVDSGQHHISYIEDLERQWTKLTNNIRAERLPEFIRYYWNTSHKSIRSKELFKTIRKEITEEKQVFELLHDMVSYSHIYMALRNCNSDVWENPETKWYVGLLNLFNLKQPYSALMAANRHLDIDDFNRVLKNIVNICFRYNVICDRNPNDQETPFNNLAIFISNNKYADLTLLQSIYIDDNTFANAFENCSMPDKGNNMQKVRYILGQIEKFRGGVSDITPDRSAASIEHILPLDYYEKWDIENEIADRMVNRLGNMCLLEDRINRDLQNEQYNVKKGKYSQSVYLTTKAISEHFDEWDEEAVNKRQKRMSEIAPSIWRVEL